MTDTYRVPKALVQDQRTRDDLPFGSQGGTVIRHNFPVDGEYTVKVLLRRQLYYYIIGMGDPHQIEIRLDGVLLKRFDMGGEAKGRAAAESFIGQNLGDPEWEVLHAERRCRAGGTRPGEGGRSRRDRLVRQAILRNDRHPPAGRTWLRSLR